MHGDHSYYTPEFRNRHSSTWLLTNKGREEAKAAGEWIRNNLNTDNIDRLYTSEYLRAMETAALLDIPGMSAIIFRLVLALPHTCIYIFIF